MSFLEKDYALERRVASLEAELVQLRDACKVMFTASSTERDRLERLERLVRKLEDRDPGMLR